MFIRRAMGVAAAILTVVMATPQANAQMRASRPDSFRSPTVQPAGLPRVASRSTSHLQQDAVVGGTVLNERTLEPIGGASVLVEGSEQGTLTDDRGRFVLTDVSGSTVTLTVQMFGYRTETQTVSTGRSDLRILLYEQALQLDGIVVTGTAGAARQREIGNSVGQIEMGNVDVSTTTVDAVLQGRTAGVTVTETTGQVGGGAAIRIRGNVSAAMGNEPIIYVDGVRVRSQGLPKNTSSTGSQWHGANVSYSPLNDIDPEDIARIEVIRGAAATTLYGTEAAAGVIQIITKRGQTGAATWTMQIDEGLARVLPFGPTEGQRGEPLKIPASERDPKYMYLDPFLRTAMRQGYTLAVTGGTDQLKYYLSGSYQNNEGVLSEDLEKQSRFRGNLTFEPLQNLMIDWNLSLAHTDLDQTAAGPSAHSVFLNAIRRDQNYIHSSDVDQLRRLLGRTDSQLLDRLVTGLTATFNPIPRFSSRLTVGYDLLQQDALSIRPYGFIMAPRGIVTENRLRNSTITVDLVGNYDIQLKDELQTTLSVGAQSVTSDQRTLGSYGQDLPGPGGEPTISSTSNTVGYADALRVVNAGFFVQDILGLKDRYFFTVGIRADGNSAFGENLGLEVYPKVSFSYVLSDESFWSESWGSLKLRAAWGQAGRAPGAFDATRTWSPDGWGSNPAIRPENVGNADLGPERTREVEVGFDGSFLDERLTAEFSYYNQKTTDALFPVAQTPSGGFTGSQLENVGTLKNTGIELGLTGSIITGDTWGLDLGTTLSTNHGKVLDLGGATRFSMGGAGNAFIQEGLPIPAVMGACVRNPSAIADPIVENNCYYGPNTPTTTISSWASLRLPYGMRASVRGEYQGGWYALAYGEASAFPRGIRWPSCANAYPSIEAGDISNLTALERARCIQNLADPDFGIYPMDFFKLRELTLSLPLPFAVPGARTTRVSLSGRNLFTWRKAKDQMADPETDGAFANRAAGMLNPVRTVGASIPPPALYTLSVRVTF